MKNARLHTACITFATLLLHSCNPAYADSFSGQIALVPNWSHTKTIGASTVEETFDPFVNWTHTDGDSTNQMTTIVRETVVLTNSQARTLNLSGGVSDSFGDVTTFSTVRFLCVTCPSANTNTISIGGSTTNAWAAWCGATNQTATIRPGGAMILIAPDLTGYAVTTNACNLMFTNNGTNSTSYSVYIGGSE